MRVDHYFVPLKYWVSRFSPTLPYVKRYYLEKANRHSSTCEYPPTRAPADAVKIYAMFFKEKLEANKE
jgi:hypothetical protein